MKHIFLALTNPVAGREAEFNRWYDEFHLGEVVRYGKGMRGGRRFRLSDVQRPGQARPPWTYLAWYDFEHEDLSEYHRKPWIVAKPPLKPFAGLVADDHAGWVYTPIGERTGLPAAAGREASADRFLFFAFTNAAEGQEAAFNAWYDQQHLPEIVAMLPGFLAGRRFRAAPEQRTTQPPPPWRYLAVYEVQAADAAAVHAAAAGVTSLTKAPAGALDLDHVAWVFEPLGAYLDRMPAAAGST
jgi:hypothetical protein